MPESGVPLDAFSAQWDFRDNGGVAAPGGFCGGDADSHERRWKHCRNDGSLGRNLRPFLYTAGTYYDLTTISGVPAATCTWPRVLTHLVRIQRRRPTPVFGPSGGIGDLVITTFGGCGWTVTSNAAWLTISSSAAGSGTGIVSYSVSPAPTGIQRLGKLTVGDQTVTIQQSGRTSVKSDFNGDGVPDLVWQNDATRAITVNYYGGVGGASYQGWNWLNTTINTGWHVVAAADFNGDGVPDLVWENDTTHQVTVHYYGGAGGASFQGWDWLKMAIDVDWSLVNSGN